MWMFFFSWNISKRAFVDKGSLRVVIMWHGTEVSASLWDATAISGYDFLMTNLQIYKEDIKIDYVGDKLVFAWQCTFCN